MKCESCNQIVEIGDWPFCPHGPATNFNVIGDDIPGGLVIQHALFDSKGQPQKFYSKSSIKKAAFEAGLTNGYDTPKPNPRLQDREAKQVESKKDSTNN